MEERMAVLESEQKRDKEDIDRLFEFLRDHMEREDEDREAIIERFHGLSKKMDTQEIHFRSALVEQQSAYNAAIGSQKAFFKGMMVVVTGVWAVIALLAAILV
jgi:hypothetical protein